MSPTGNEKLFMVNSKERRPDCRSGKTGQGPARRFFYIQQDALRSAPQSANKRELYQRSLTRLVIVRAACCDRTAPPRGRLRAGSAILTCAIGSAGIQHRKREGDGATPAGRFACLGGFFKAGAMGRPRTLLSLRPISKDMGWCDDPQAANYNRLVRLPVRVSHETLWRDDGLYDLVIVLDYNFTRRAKSRGSAIFLHCARADFAPTAGCIALTPEAWRRLLPRLSRHVKVIVR